MKTWVRNTMLASPLLLMSLNASADHDIWMGIKAGTLGLGVEAAWKPIPWFDVRVGANQFDYDDTGSQAGVNYDGELALETFYATANFSFPLSPMRFTAGLFSNGNELNLVSRDTPALEIGDTVYPGDAVGTLRSTTSFSSTAPYAGIGFDFEAFDKVGVNLDFGVLWQGDPDVTLTADGILGSDPGFLDDLEQERQELEDEVDDYKAWPVVSIGFTYEFL